MTSSVESSLILKLVDHLTGPSRQVSASLERLDAQMKSIRSFADGPARSMMAFANSMQRDTAQISRATTQMVERHQQMRRTFAMPIAPSVDLRGILASAGVYVGLRETFDATIGASMRFEESFADVRKVVDGSATEVDRLRGSIMQMSKTLPVTSDGLADIMAAAGQAGVSLEDLPTFTNFTAKAAIAFDMNESEIGDRFAKLKNVFKLDQTGLEELADSANVLSNQMASSASEITDFANRAAGAAKTLGLLPRELAAVGSAMASAGIAPETAARGISAMTNKVIAGGPKVTKAFKSIGLSFKEWRKLQREDGPAALTTLFEHAAKKGDKGLQALQDLVGQDFSDDFSKLIANPALLAEAFQMVADAGKVAGSVQAEFINKSDTAAKKIQLLKNNVSALGVAMGDLVAPSIGNWAADFANTLATINSRVTVFDTVKAKIDALMAGLGVQGVSGGWDSIRDSIFGTVEGFDKDTQKMLVASGRWREIGASMRSVFDAISASPIGTISGSMVADMAKIGAAAAALSLAARPIMALGRALLFLSGISPAYRVISYMATLGTTSTAAAAGISAAAVSTRSLAGALRTLTIAGAGVAGIMELIGRFGPEVAKNTRPVKPGEPADWLGIDPSETREQRLERLNEERTRSRGGPRSRAPYVPTGGIHRVLMDEPSQAPRPAAAVPVIRPEVDLTRASGDLMAFAGKIKDDLASITLPNLSRWEKDVQALKVDVEPVLNYSVLEQDTKLAADRMTTNLAVTATPTVNTASIDAAIQKASAFRAMLSGMVGGGAAAPTSGLPKFGGPRAGGGPIQRGMTYLVGEKGPELMTAGTNGYITPNNKIGGANGAAGGGTTIINNKFVIDGSGANAEEIVRQIMQKFEATLSRSTQTSLVGRGRY